MFVLSNQQILIYSLILNGLFKFCNTWLFENKIIESNLLRNYNRKHRPVKSESTIMKIRVYLMINHIEKVVCFLIFNKNIY